MKYHLVNILRILRFNLFASVILFNSAYGITLSISPIHIDLSPKYPIAMLKITNHSNKTTVIQLSAHTWSQSNQNNIEHNTNDLLITPPLFRLMPGNFQIIRIADTKYKPSAVEKGYRLMVEQVLPAQIIANTKPNHLRIRLRISLPVFIHSVIPAHPAYHWTISPTSNHRIKLTLYNTGNTILFISGWQLLNQKHPLLPPTKTFVYLFPDQHYFWYTEALKHHTHFAVVANITSK